MVRREGAAGVVEGGPRGWRALTVAGDAELPGCRVWDRRRATHVILLYPLCPSGGARGGPGTWRDLGETLEVTGCGQVGVAPARWPGGTLHGGLKASGARVPGQHGAPLPGPAQGEAAGHECRPTASEYLTRPNKSACIINQAGAEELE